MSFQNLPQVDKILNLERFHDAVKPILSEISREILNEQRELLRQTSSCLSKDEIIEKIAQKYREYEQTGFVGVINATGVVIHTNLGRSVIDEQIYDRAKELVCSYSSLEYNLNLGQRGNRYDHISRLLSALFNSEDALIVNNNASAVFLVLNTFAKGGETVVSRGELVEIGGSFRVPDVMSASGTSLKEIGTTNKTKLSDYENALNENTKMLLKVHRSNFDIVGFSEDVGIDEIARLAREKNLLDYYDLGSGYVGELPYNLGKNEPNVSKVLQSGVSLVSFSGDKLFGSVQCGVILGKKELIAKLRKNQLLRMLRVDKVIISLLCESIKAYINKEFTLIPTVNQLYKSTHELEILANVINKSLKKELEIYHTSTFVGGGTMPNKNIPSVALCFEGDAMQNEARFRAKRVIGRIENDKFILDLRSVLDKDVNRLIKIINEVAK
ncbi:L-seryl-tRNA(Sec) selenium transferase [Campylobacter sp. RM9344]|uniref:L-seryl-tRNA(Sec) selenium transferase n=1 Tax=Campylobacter californiensis TaxID=1032243 RepID=A0AAW3ZW42_9BACT|nr:MULTISPECIES: L-seryl-tRNA(Sec) selenium transferase [unclassified Campylobacter]MBE2984056.1 L-seryl-tRNA(Sec) selenium transferase [Campylobacter sp. RM6883]MBE2987118.1 L-seryl-tRNA(Sec) selenium transferase [Campylobacter sp. RM12919]MBE2988377.1 L-seryl-tRNA(Sec) selenium transferase [Campylobacter sp. RM12920]MBE2995481.1 L-seryl-tRNA(Sec) selenium transferase [Campylobacter sp. RM6913]MBE3029825.1 L-seryl-tRNA(Sec) selenium transferase [Campylobacter sp. RM9344]